MPALIGGFGNFLLPLGLGGPDNPNNKFLFNIFKQYKIFSYIIIFVYSIYVNRNKIILTHNGLWVFILLGVFTEDPTLYYNLFLLYYIIDLVKNYLKDNKKKLSKYPIKYIDFLIFFMEVVQALLLVIIVDILINTLVSYLSKALGHILKMFNPWNNNNNNQGANNDPNGNNPYGNNPNGNNPYGNNPNGNNPNGNNDYYNIVEGDNPNERQRRIRIANDYSNYEETRRVAHRIFYETKNSELGEGVETTFDSRGRKISKIY